MGDRWWEAEDPCISFSCSDEGIQTVTKVCPAETCQEVLNPSTAATSYTILDMRRRTDWFLWHQEDRIWDHQHCCYTCKSNQNLWKLEDMFDHWLSKVGEDDTLVLQATRAAHQSWPAWTSPSATVAASHWCPCVRVNVRRSRGEMETATSQNLISHGFLTRPGSLWLSRVVFDGDLQVEQTHQSCQKRRSERRPLTLQCLDLTSRTYVYEHITACDCRDCGAAETPAG